MDDNDLNSKLVIFCKNMNRLAQMSENFSNYYFELMEEPDDDDNIWYKLDSNFTYVYANSSIYWLYLLLKDTNLSEHPIKEEIARVKKYMQEYLILKKDAPKLNINAAKNFIRNALWDPTAKRKDPEESSKSNEVNEKKLKTK